jgi:hypothetical protein
MGRLERYFIATFWREFGIVDWWIGWEQDLGSHAHDIAVMNTMTFYLPSIFVEHLEY